MRKFFTIMFDVVGISCVALIIAGCGDAYQNGKDGPGVPEQKLMEPAFKIVVDDEEDITIKQFTRNTPEGKVRCYTYNLGLRSGSFTCWPVQTEAAPSGYEATTPEPESAAIPEGCEEVSDGNFVCKFGGE